VDPTARPFCTIRVSQRFLFFANQIDRQAVCLFAEATYAFTISTADVGGRYSRIQFTNDSLTGDRNCSAAADGDVSQTENSFTPKASFSFPTRSAEFVSNATYAKGFARAAPISRAPGRVRVGLPKFRHYRVATDFRSDTVNSFEVGAEQHK